MSKSKYEYLFDGQLRMCLHKNYKREYKFHAKRKWRFDFAFPAQMIGIEIHGGIYSGGRHVRGKGFANDCEKYTQAALLGWKILHFTPEEVKNGKALSIVMEVLGEKFA